MCSCNFFVKKSLFILIYSHGYLPETTIERKVTLKDSLKKALPEVGGMVISLTSTELSNYWAEKYAAYTRESERTYG